MAVKGPQARRAPRSSRLAPAQRRAHGASLRGQCPRPVLAGVTRPVAAQRVRVGRGALESLGQARGQTPPPLQLAGPAVTSRALPEPSGAFRGSADGTSVRNLLCNKTTHKVKCRLKSLCLRGSSFYGVACLGEAGTSPLATRVGSAEWVGPQGLRGDSGSHEAVV